nr:unnamed protein product [Digitaria exilis]
MSTNPDSGESTNPGSYERQPQEQGTMMTNLDMLRMRRPVCADGRPYPRRAPPPPPPPPR